jgi:predicted secreted protein
MKRISPWVAQICDRRSGRVIFLAHCLLNENTRYLGGARRGGAVREIVQQCLDHDIGIVQLPCPEQHAWGGVLKCRLLGFFGSQGTVRYRLRGMLLPLMIWYTRRVYRRLARQAAALISDYQQAGFTVAAIVGIDASPSCGVSKTLAMDHALEQIGRLRRGASTAEEMNAIVRGNTIAGRGLYIELLQAELNQRGIRIPFDAHDLVAELEGKPSSVEIAALVGSGTSGR